MRSTSTSPTPGPRPGTIAGACSILRPSIWWWVCSRRAARSTSRPITPSTARRCARCSSRYPAVAVERVEGPWPDGARTHYETKYEREGRPILRLVVTRLAPARAPLLHPDGVDFDRGGLARAGVAPGGTFDRAGRVKRWRSRSARATFRASSCARDGASPSIAPKPGAGSPSAIGWSAGWPTASRSTPGRVAASGSSGTRRRVRWSRPRRTERIDLERAWILSFRRDDPRWEAATRLQLTLLDADRGCDLDVLQSGFHLLAMSSSLTIWEEYRRRWRDALERLAERSG